MKRQVEHELLDELAPSDLRAMGSRRDLQKVNAWMGHARIMDRVLADAFTHQAPRSIADLGGGDGTLLLRLAKRIGPRYKPVRAVLVDRQRLLGSKTRDEFAALSWQVESLEVDIFDWLQRPYPKHHDVTVASLFLHHFTWTTISGDSCGWRPAKPDCFSHVSRGEATSRCARRECCG